MAHSLKEKRRPVKSLKDKLSHRFNASVAELDYLESWQKSLLGLCFLSKDKAYLDKQINLIESLVSEFSDLELTNMTREWL